MIQTEYTLAYALVFAMISLGVVALVVPRPRKADLPENLERKRKEHESEEKRRRMLPQAYRGKTAPTKK
ncbi:MAG TPA: hypothetical protein PKD54_06175 [Pirellulaceae bacterium]|nr:hypothetical protein [Pirellulaceae bacterium]